MEHIKSDEIGIKLNHLIKHSRKMRNYFKTLELTKQNITKIIQLLANDTYECNNIQQIITLFKIIAPNNETYIWSNLENIMLSYTEEFNQDQQLYEILNNIVTNNNNNNNSETDALLIIIKSFKKYGSHLQGNDRSEFIKLKNRIDEIHFDLHEQITKDGYIDITYDIDLLNNKNLHIFCKIINDNNNEKKILFITKKSIEHIMLSTKIDIDCKKKIYDLYIKHCNNYFGDIYNILKIKNKMALYLNHSSFSEMESTKCMNNNDIDIVKDLIAKLDKIVDIEFNNIIRDCKLNVADIQKYNYYDMKYLFSKYKQNKIEYIGGFDLITSFREIILIIQSLFKIKFVFIGNIYNIYDIDDNNNDILMGYINVDIYYNDKKKFNNIQCISLSKFANYPYGSDKFILPSSIIIGNLQKNISYYDIINLAHELIHCIHSLFGKNNFSILNGIVCESDVVELPSILIEHYFWSDHIINKFLTVCNKNLNLIDHVKKLHYIDTSINIKHKCVIALFDNLLHSSSQIIKICDPFIKNNKKLAIIFNDIYKNIVEQVMYNALPFKNWTNIDYSVILNIIGPGSGLSINMLISEILCYNIFNSHPMDNICLSLKSNIFNNYKLNTKHLMGHIFINNNDNDNSNDNSNYNSNNSLDIKNLKSIFIKKL